MMTIIQIMITLTMIEKVSSPVATLTSIYNWAGLNFSSTITRWLIINNYHKVATINYHKVATINYQLSQGGRQLLSRGQVIKNKPPNTYIVHKCGHLSQPAGMLIHDQKIVRYLFIIF